MLPLPAPVRLFQSHRAEARSTCERSFNPHRARRPGAHLVPAGFAGLICFNPHRARRPGATAVTSPFPAVFRGRRTGESLGNSSLAQ